MTQFSRRSRWLNTLFPASVRPQTTDPSSVSEDVSLVQPYDGSGYGIPNPRSWIIQNLLAAGVTGSSVMITVPEDSVYRLMGAGGFNVAASGTPRHQLFVQDLIAVPNLACQLAPIEIPTVGDGNFAFDLGRAIVIGPGHNLLMAYTAGGAGTIMKYSIYGVLAPLGTVFYC